MMRFSAVVLLILGAAQYTAAARGRLRSQSLQDPEQTETPPAPTATEETPVLTAAATSTSSDSSESTPPKEGGDASSHPEPPFRRDGWLKFSAEGRDDVQVDLEVPNSYDKFMEGLMYRKSMCEMCAMLFAWDEDGSRPFWMENTYIPLDMVWVNHAMEVTDIKQAKAMDLSSVANDNPAQYVVELGVGWCDKHGVKVGDKVSFQHESSQEYFMAHDRPSLALVGEKYSENLKKLEAYIPSK